MGWGALAGGAAGLIGGYFQNKSNKNAAARDRAMQREFAQNGIQWRVADAKKAGIHPLAALGASTHSASPVNVGAPGMDPSIGQNISRAVNAAIPSDQKRQLQLQQNAQLRKTEAEIKVLESQASSINQTTGMPSRSNIGQMDGQSSSQGGLVQINPSQNVARGKGTPGIEAGNIASVRPQRNADGSVWFVQTEDSKQASEDNAYREARHSLKHTYINPPREYQQAIKKMKPYPGMKFQWSALEQGYIQVPKKQKNKKSSNWLINSAEAIRRNTKYLKKKKYKTNPNWRDYERRY